MTEVKKGLRITAGILLLVWIGISFLSDSYTKFLSISTASLLLNGLPATLLTLGCNVVWIGIAVFLLLRKFKAAGIAQFLSAALFAAIACWYLFATEHTGVPVAVTVLLVCSYLLNIARDVVLGAAFFRQPRHEKRFFLAGGFLTLAGTLVSACALFPPLLDQSVPDLLLLSVAFPVLIAVSICGIAFLAWLFTALWNSAQKNADEPAPRGEPPCEP